MCNWGGERVFSVGSLPSTIIPPAFGQTELQ